MVSEFMLSLTTLFILFFFRLPTVGCCCQGQYRVSIDRKCGMNLIQYVIFSGWLDNNFVFFFYFFFVWFWRLNYWFAIIIIKNSFESDYVGFQLQMKWNTTVFFFFPEFLYCIAFYYRTSSNILTSVDLCIIKMLLLLFFSQFSKLKTKIVFVIRAMLCDKILRTNIFFFFSLILTLHMIHCVNS